MPDRLRLWLIACARGAWSFSRAAELGCLGRLVCTGAVCRLVAKPLEPIGVLRVSAAKREDRVWKPFCAGVVRANTHHHGTIASLFERKSIVRDRCRFVGRPHQRGNAVRRFLEGGLGLGVFSGGAAWAKRTSWGGKSDRISMPESPCGANHRHCQPTARLWGKSADEARFDGCVCFLTLEKRSRYTARRTPCDRVARRLLPRFRPASYKLARAEN